MPKSTNKSLRCALIAGLAMPLATTGQVGVILNPNDFKGTVSLTGITTNSAVHSILKANFQMGILSLIAIGENNGLFASNSTTFFPQADPLTGKSYTVTAQASFGNVGSALYKLLAISDFRTTGGPYANTFVYDDMLNPVALVNNAPATVVNFKECIGIVKVDFSDSCTMPTASLILNKVSLNSTRSNTSTNGPASELLHIAKTSVTPQLFTLHYTYGSDPYKDQIQNETTFEAPVSCDQVNATKCFDFASLHLPCIGASCPQNNGLGNIIGWWDVAAETENANDARTRIAAVNGIFGNFRWNDLGGEPGSINPPKPPASPPRKFDLVNLVPSKYDIYGETTSRQNRAYVFIQSDSVPRTVLADQTTDLGNTFWMKKARIFGDITFTHFPDPLNAIDPSSGLKELYFSDADAVMGIPKTLDLSDGSRLSFCSGKTLCNNPSTSITAWPFNTATGDSHFAQTRANILSSNYDLPVVRADNVAGSWPSNGITNLELQFGKKDVFGSDENNLPRPNGRIFIQEFIAPKVLDPKKDPMTDPDAFRKVDFEYCFGHVSVTYQTSSGNLYNPQASITGSYNALLEPLDKTNKPIFSRMANYRVSGTFGGKPQSVAGKSSTGQLLMTLPRGKYGLTPTVNSDNGSLIKFTPPPDFDLGCNQFISIKVGVSKACDADGDVDIDRNDLALISRARGKTPVSNDPRDANGDGLINAADVKACIPKCTRPNCAP